MRFLVPLLLCLVSAHAQVGVLYLGGAVPPTPSTITNTTAGLVNWWKFDENTGVTTADSIGSAAGTLSGASLPTWTNAIVNSGLDFGGSPAYVQLAANTDVGTGPFTVSFWIRPEASFSGTIIYDSDNDNSGGFWVAMSAPAFDVKINIVGSTKDLVSESDNNSVPIDTWTFIAITWAGTITDASGAHIYTNAVETTYFSQVNGGGSHGANSTASRFIGKGGTGASGFFSGALDDLRLWNRVLDGGEITNMYQWRGQP